MYNMMELSPEEKKKYEDKAKSSDRIQGAIGFGGAGLLAASPWGRALLKELATGNTSMAALGLGAGATIGGLYGNPFN